MNIRLNFIVGLLLLLFFNKSSAQHEQVPLQRWYTSSLERQNNQDQIHFGIKPIKHSVLADSAFNFYYKDSRKYYFNFGRLLLRDHLLEIKRDDYRISVDPIGDFSFGVNSGAAPIQGRDFYVNTRGLLLKGEIGRHFTFQSGFYEMQRLPIDYQTGFIAATGVFPGFGRVKTFKSNGYDHSMSFGRINYRFSDHFNLELGNDKIFVGHGYRSMLLTDGIFNYPYIKGNLTFFDGKLDYTSIFTVFQALERLPLGEVPESLFKRKNGTFNYLSFKPSSWLELGVFEGVVWQRISDSSRVNLPLNAYVPLLGVNTAIEGFDGLNNAYSGMSIKIQPHRNFYFYGQAVANGLESDQLGYQAGARVFNLGLQNLDIQVEWNSTEANVYSGPNSVQTLSHYNQYLGHPGGNNMREWVVIADYQYRRWVGQVKYNELSKVNLDYTIKQLETEVGYRLNLKTNLQILAGYTHRDDIVKYDVYSITLRTNIHNRYFDF